MIASPTSRSAMAADLLITDSECKRAYSVQVKTNKVTFGFWLMGRRCLELVSPTFIYVLVNLRKDGPEYFIVPSQVVAEKVIVSKASATRKQTWHSLYRKEIEGYRDAWNIFDRKEDLPNQPRMPVSGTPAADAPVAPPSGGAGR